MYDGLRVQFVRVSKQAEAYPDMFQAYCVNSKVLEFKHDPMNLPTVVSVYCL